MWITATLSQRRKKSKDAISNTSTKLVNKIPAWFKEKAKDITHKVVDQVEADLIDMKHTGADLVVKAGSVIGEKLDDAGEAMLEKSKEIGHVVVEKTKEVSHTVIEKVSHHESAQPAATPTVPVTPAAPSTPEIIGEIPASTASTTVISDTNTQNPPIVA